MYMLVLVLLASFLFFDGRASPSTFGVRQGERMILKPARRNRHRSERSQQLGEMQRKQMQEQMQEIVWQVRLCLICPPLYCKSC
jgi:hypothetical protein